ncbi:MAG: chemotaxis protein CheB [Pseudomonadota bacterium]
MPLQDSASEAATLGDGSPKRQLGQVDLSFYIVGVGASAGGLDAIKQLIAQADENFQHSFVIIQHISPDHKSLMTEILTRETALRVREVVDDMPVQPGHIYLIPPKSNVVIQGTLDDTQPQTEDMPTGIGKGLRFSLVPPSPRPQLNLPIDVFFHSLAESVGDRAIGIVLSGTGTDGSRGLRAIKDRDGFVLVQDPETADFDGMPSAAIATRLIDLVAAPDAMVPELRRYIELREAGIFDIDALFREDEKSLELLLERVSQAADIDFIQYKRPTLKRRIARRIALTQCNDLSGYIGYVQENPNELAILHREFLVGVTNFFRDLPAWGALSENVFQKLFKDGDPSEPVKVWSVGCSTGEEAYTIAFAMERFRLENNISRDFRIFASDVNEDAIRSAKDGIYPDSVLEEIPGAYRAQEYLKFHGGTFHISSSLRNRVIFNSHNVLQDPPYINTDLIICRNLLIYFSPDMQKKVLSLFSFSLRNEGYLFLGAAENVMHQFSKFEAAISSSRIYRNMRPQQRGSMHGSFDPRRSPNFPLPRMRRLATRETQRATSVLAPIFEATLGNIDGALVIIDEGGSILETLGNYRKFIDLPHRAFSANIFDLVHDRLKSAISILLRRAEAEGTAESLATKCSFGDHIEQVDVFCRRVEWETQPVAYSLLLRKTDQIDTTPIEEKMEDNRRGDQTLITRLESEIESLREMLSVTTEDLGISNEELQTANEELTVSNEELQANNEEMQSINEELHTVNAENGEKITQLEAASADIENLLNTADLAVVFLDDNLCIRRFNPAFTKYVDLKATDIGRRLSSFSSFLTQESYATLLTDTENALLGEKEVQRELPLRDGSWTLTRVRPFFVNGSGEVRGSAITILDITKSRLLQEEVSLQRDRLEGLLESETAGYWDRDFRSGVEYVSPRFNQMLGYSSEDVEATSERLMQLVHPDDRALLHANLTDHIASKGRVPYQQEVRYRHKRGNYLWFLRRGRINEWTEAGEPKRMIGVHVDISELKERELRVSADAKQIAGFAYSTVHSLLQPTNTIAQGLRLITEHASMDEDDLETIDAMQEMAARMQLQIRGVQEYSELFSPTEAYHKISLDRIVAACQVDQMLRIQELGAEIEVSELPPIEGNEQLITRVFQILIGNALKFRDPQRPCKISIAGRAEADGVVALTVSDNGIGILPDVRPKVFDLFYKYHGDRELPGIGAGLTVCKRIVELHGGSIKVGEAEDEGGAAFEIRLPATQDA